MAENIISTVNDCQSTCDQNFLVPLPPKSSKHTSVVSASSAITDLPTDASEFTDCGSVHSEVEDMDASNTIKSSGKKRGRKPLKNRSPASVKRSKHESTSDNSLKQMYSKVLNRLATLIKDLTSASGRIAKLERENKVFLSENNSLANKTNKIISDLQTSDSKKTETIEQLRSSLDNLAKSGNSPDSQFSFASIVKGTKNNEATNFMIHKCSKDISERARVERNVVISGIKDNNNAEQDLIAVQKVLSSIGAPSCQSIRRIKSRINTQPASRPPLLIAEFSNTTDKFQALKVARLLRTKSDMAGVYINPDRTASERAAHKALREGRDERNRNLDHISTNGRHR